MTQSRAATLSSEELVAALCQVDAYPEKIDTPVVLHETHVSWVFLAGEFAYKVKKPITTSFLDYSTLERRQRFCHEEIRLDRRYAAELYLGVVPITMDGNVVRMDGSGETVEYAVKMQRFPEDALLSDRIDHGALLVRDVIQLADAVAEFHRAAAVARPDGPFGLPEDVFRSATDNFRDLEQSSIHDRIPETQLDELSRWSNEFYARHRQLFTERVGDGFVRECHGDLHLANVIYWRGRLMPFDGIEFNDEFRWIDVLSDAAFLAMDLAARGHDDLSHAFINAYLEQTGDYGALPLLRWYLVFRSLVRAKVAAIRAAQPDVSDADRDATIGNCQDHIDLASRFTSPPAPRLWITHGLSGSGKTTGSESIIQRWGAIRLRSDVERKRRFGLESSARPGEETKSQLYSETAIDAVYADLRRMAKDILAARYPVVVDATFLKQQHRRMFQQLSESAGVPFTILEFHAELPILRERLTRRQARKTDASDADLDVLELQIRSLEPLSETERQNVVRISDTDSAAGLQDQG